MQETQKLESLGVLAGGIAHDFNNLLVGVLANAELALSALERSPDALVVRDRIEDVRSAAHHAAELTNQMLAYSGRGRFDIRPISLTAIVREMSQLRGASISKKARVSYQLAVNLPAVQADVTQIRQVIMNLITNASDALEDRVGSIQVRTGTERADDSLRDLYGPVPLAPGQYAYVEVTDDGCGMNEETRSRLFEPFFTTRFTGRGLGLSAVQGIVRGHGGGITMRTALGMGTTIKVLLPCSER
jgi:signal transduction histidine kinase